MTNKTENTGSHTADQLLKSVSKTAHRPAVEEFIDVIVKEVETAKQSNSQGATDADVQAEEG